MRKSKIIFAILSAAALLACSVSSADARGFGHRDGGPVADILGGVVVGAVTIATLPFVLLADAAHGGSRRRGYYGADDYAGYGPPPGNYGREGYGYGPPQGYYDYGPPPPPPPRYYRSYGPPRGYYGY